MESGLQASDSIQIEIVALSRLLRVVRFANSVIHQPMEERDLNFFVRVLRDGKLGFASINGLGEESLHQALNVAKTNAELPKSASSIHAFPKPIAVPHTDGAIPATRSTGTEALEDRVGKLLSCGKGTGISFAGVFWTSTTELSVLNSNGVKRYHTWTAANCQTVATKGDLSGFSAQASPDVNAIRPTEVGEAAVHRALRFSNSIELPPGEYECLLSEYAVAELLIYLAYMSFTADSVEEGRSILGIKKGMKIASPSVSIWDDGTNPLSFQIPFDFEGMPRKKVTFINRGIAEDVVHDVLSAARANVESTGHAVPADYSEGPIPLHLEMAGGTSSKDEMVSSMKRGLLVTRLHYIREVHALKTMVTGMTRDGVYLVENGRVTARVKNFRFTESILRALSNVLAISNDRKLVAAEINGGMPTAVIVPKVLVSKFAFTGSTQF